MGEAFGICLARGRGVLVVVCFTLFVLFLKQSCSLGTICNVYTTSNNVLSSFTKGPTI